jgi:D-alanine--poly(phosphoribitol) ligase subunit 1
VIDESGRSQPPGVVGEVVASGAVIFDGYANGEAQEKFLSAIQFDNDVVAAGRWYTTGDYGYLDENKELHLRGRTDDQVKINGQVSLYKYTHDAKYPCFERSSRAHCS